MQALLALLPVFQEAVAVFGAFKGSAAEAKASSILTSAIGVINAATPLFNQFYNGQEVTEADVRAALAGMHRELDLFDAEIKRQGG